VQTGRADQMRGFAISGFSAEDAEHLRRGAEHPGPVVPAVLDALYDHLLSLPETRSFFETQDIQHRKQSLVSWMTRMIEGPAGSHAPYLSRACELRTTPQLVVEVARSGVP
jgi:hypothetical protein